MFEKGGKPALCCSTRRSTAARVWAMYTNPAYARRGVGRLILSGFRPLERLEDTTGGAALPLVRMDKPVDPSLLR